MAEMLKGRITQFESHGAFLAEAANLQVSEDRIKPILDGGLFGKGEFVRLAATLGIAPVDVLWKKHGITQFLPGQT